MKLATKTRKRLYEAGSKPIEISWPSDAPEPFRGHRYPVYGNSGRLFQIRVEAVKRNKKLKALVVIDNDSHRPMIGLQGVRREDGSYETEPERVSASYECQLAGEATQRNSIRTAERTGKGKLAEEYAAREKRRVVKNASDEQR